MTNNDILRQLRYIFDLTDQDMIEIFESADYTVERWQVSDWLKNDDEKQLQLYNSELNIFLDGFINLKRGKRENYTLRKNDELTNNAVLRKLKIALDFRDHHILEIFKAADMEVGKHELSAFLEILAKINIEKWVINTLELSFMG